jgi:hypothetical protein
MQWLNYLNAGGSHRLGITYVGESFDLMGDVRNNTVEGAFNIFWEEIMLYMM